MPSPESTTLTVTSLLPNIPTGDSPDAIRQRIPQIRAITELSYMQLARDLWSVFHRKLYTDWGFESFDHYVRHEVGISKDRSYRLRRIFSVFVMKCDIPPATLNVLGRSKAERLLPFVTKKNAHDWVSRAQKMTYDELLTEIETEKAKQVSPDPAPSAEVEPPSTVSPVRLTKPPREGFVERKFYLPEDSDTLLTESLGEAQRITKSASDSFNLSCILQHFLAHRLTQEGKDDGRLGWFMRNMERVYGVRLIRVKDTDEAWGILQGAVESRPDLFGTSDHPDLLEGEQEKE
jgi:hypothetical protein